MMKSKPSNFGKKTTTLLSPQSNNYAAALRGQAQYATTQVTPKEKRPDLARYTLNFPLTSTLTTLLAMIRGPPLSVDTMAYLQQSVKLDKASSTYAR